MDIIDTRIVLFLFFAFLTGVILFLREGSIASIKDVVQILLDFLLVPVALLTVAIFVGVITRSDPTPLIREAGYQVGLQQLINFANAVPDNLQDELAVTDVRRIDTDNDGFSEWVVFYQFDLQNGRSPVQAMVYDNDRGDPPVIFPYALRPPNRDYLGEGSASIEMSRVLEEEDQDQVMVWGGGNTSLTIFKFEDNSEVWDFPRDAPPRYRPIGFFRGNGGVRLDNDTKDVTVIDRNGFERSQLAIRSIYTLNPATNTYLDSFDSTKLAAPVVSTIDFYQRPPANILTTDFPEKIVLAFYASLCNSQNNTLCNRADLGWDPADFLTADALNEFRNGNAAYFGLDSLGVNNISVTDLRYFPQLETDPDLLVTGGGRDVVTGEQGQFNLVDITFVTGNGPLETVRYEMRLIEGRWKMVRRVEIQEATLGAAQEFQSPTETPLPPPPTSTPVPLPTATP